VKRRTGIVVGVVLVIGLVVGFAASAMAGDDSPTGGNRIISVSASATASEAPDEAVVDLAVRSEDESSGRAFAANAEDMQAVLDALKAAGVAEKDVETLNVNLSQRTVDRHEATEHRVYVASNSVQVTIHDLDSVGSVIDAAVQAGADSVNDIRFQLSDSNRVQTDALEQAVHAAREKADALAAAAGAQVVRVRSIDEGNVQQPEQQYRAFALASDAAAPTPVVPPDQLEASVTVNVVWEIG
jgi:uncharacterized protein YggE